MDADFYKTVIFWGLVLFVGTKAMKERRSKTQRTPRHQQNVGNPKQN